MQIFIHGGDKTCVINVDPNENIDLVRMKAYYVTKGRLGNPLMVYSSKILSAGKTLSDYMIHEQSTINCSCKFSSGDQPEWIVLAYKDLNNPKIHLSMNEFIEKYMPVTRHP